MAGIYIHIPFCRQACHYCNFHFSTSLRYKNEFIAALLKEIELFAASPLAPRSMESELIETIYFGGGTPSLCTVTEIKSVLQQLNAFFIVAPEVEITLEANPDDITEDNLKDWKVAGINRLSIGVQSFFEDDLQWMNRAHTSRQAINSLQKAMQHFQHITIDLIYGTPQLTNEKWKQNVETAVALQIPHLSCYALTVEPKTPLDKMIRQDRSPAIDPDKQSEQFLLLIKWLEEAGYEHYEISNFAKPGFRSRHNSSYWQGTNYYGFGPSAHSFNGLARWWNIANNNIYIESIAKAVIPFEKEELTIIQRLNEYIMISLRTAGLHLESAEHIAGDYWKAKNGKQVRSLLLDKSRKYIERGLLKLEKDILILTNEGKMLADGIAADLFMEE